MLRNHKRFSHHHSFSKSCVWAVEAGSSPFCNYTLVSSSHFIYISIIVYLTVCICMSYIYLAFCYIYIFEIYTRMKVCGQTLHLTSKYISFECTCGMLKRILEFRDVQQPGWIYLLTNIRRMKLHWWSLWSFHTSRCGWRWLCAP